MNRAITYQDLPAVERQIADLYATGHTKKEIAAIRNRSIFTIDNQVRKLFEKTDTHKDAEFASWYFCTRFHISMDLLPIHRALVSLAFLLMMTVEVIGNGNPQAIFRRASAGRVRTESVRRVRRTEEI